MIILDQYVRRLPFSFLIEFGVVGVIKEMVKDHFNDIILMRRKILRYEGCYMVRQYIWNYFQNLSLNPNRASTSVQL